MKREHFSLAREQAIRQKVARQMNNGWQKIQAKINGMMDHTPGRDDGEEARQA